MLGCLGIGIAVLLILALTMCRGPYLGSYRFENARLVDSSALATIEPSHPALEEATQLIRIEFTSDQDLETASGGSGPGLYVHGDFCPGHDEYRLAALGPYCGDRSPYTRRNRRERPLPNGGVAIDGDQLHPSRDPRSGRYLYTAYIFPSRPANSFDGTRHESYDLRRDGRDLCLWIDHPGYYVTRSQSDVFVIPRGAIAAALRPPSPAATRP